MAIQWSPLLAVGVSQIDQQHQELYDRINRLLEACNEGKGISAVNETIQFLGEYVVSHFQTEENMMLAANYPGYGQHKVAHDDFIAKLSELTDSVEQEGSNVKTVIVTNRLVIGWLNSHIMNVDKEFGKFLNSKG